MSANKNRSSRIERIEVAAPADNNTTITGAEIDSAQYSKATVVFHLAGITGGGNWTVGLTSSDTSGGSFTAETSADVFIGGAPAALVNADAGVVAYDLDLGMLDRRYIRVVITKAGTISASLNSASFEGELKIV